MTPRLARVPAGNERDRYLPLLLLADESEQQVRSYMNEGILYAYFPDETEAAGIVLAIPESDGAVELKAVAVSVALHGQGVGSAMLRAVIADLRASGVKRLVVGTGNSGIGQLAYYQKAGFRLWKIERDFFSPERGYPDGIEENGIPLRDMVWMDQQLDK